MDSCDSSEQSNSCDGYEKVNNSNLSLYSSDYTE